MRAASLERLARPHENLKGLDRKQRFDMNKGLKIEALRVTTDQTEAPEAAAGASA
jgi:hypothetical protein